MGTLFVDNIKQQSSQGSGTITIGASGETVALASGVKQSNLLTPAFEAVIGSTQTISNATETKVTFETENFDTDNAYDNSTNYRFTPQTAGKYFCYAQVRPVTSGSNTTQYTLLRFFKNGTKIAQSQISTYPNADLDSPSISHGRVFTLNGSTDYIEVFVVSEGGGSMTLATGTENPNVFGAYRIGD
jgi:hypothetical protein